MRSGQHIHLTISGIHLTVNFTELVTITENFMPFMDNGIKTDYRAEFTEVGILPSAEGELLTRLRCLENGESNHQILP